MLNYQNEPVGSCVCDAFFQAFPVRPPRAAERNDYMIFGRSGQQQAQTPSAGQSVQGTGYPQQNASPWNGAQGYPAQPSGTGYTGYTPGTAQGTAGFDPGGTGYGNPGYGGAAQSGQVPQGYGGQGGYAGANGAQQYPAGQNYGAAGMSGAQRYGQEVRPYPTMGQGYGQTGYAPAGQGYTGSQGYGAGAPGYGANAQGYTAYQGYGQAAGGQGQNGYAYPQMNGAQGQNGYAYPQMNGAQGYGAQGYAQGQGAYGQPAGAQGQGYAQMGRNQAQPQAYQQIPLNGGGYVPQPVPVRKQPFVFKSWMLIALGAVLIVLFGAGLALRNNILLWLFAVLAAGSAAFFWVKPLVSGNRRLCYTIVLGVLTVIAAVTALGLLSPRTDSTNTPGGVAAQGGSGAASGGTVIDSQTGNAINVAEQTEVPATPTPPAADNATAERLDSFFRYWSANRTDEMLTLCAPSWQSKVDNPKMSLFGLLANRTPLDYTIEKITGTPEDSSRTVTVTSTIDRGNGKDPVKYRLSVLMLREGDTWFVDPQSLKTYDEAETPDPAMEATPTPSPEPLVSSSTVLYYNPDGGKQYHLDPNCKSAHEKFLPFKGKFTYGEINDEPYVKLDPCNVCAAPLRP